MLLKVKISGLIKVNVIGGEKYEPTKSRKIEYQLKHSSVHATYMLRKGILV